MSDEERLVEAAWRGALLLDEHVIGWHERIDPERLRLNSHCDCVLGQLFGRYEVGLRHLIGEGRLLPEYHNAGYRFGFVPRLHRDEELTAAWRAEVARRVGAAVTVANDCRAAVKAR